MSRRKGGRAVKKKCRASRAAPAALSSPAGGGGAARLHLIARDPHSLFATWRWRPAAQMAPGRGPRGTALAPGRLVLRVLDVSPLPSASRRPLQFFVGTRKSFYIRVPGNGRRYRAELGWQEGARFIPLARSRTVETPPAGPAPATVRGAPALAHLHPGPTGPLPSSRDVPVRRDRSGGPSPR